jgi:ketosteroid isomerase-like protein
VGNAERMRQAVADFADGGADAALWLFAPDVVWVAPPEWVDQPVYCGHDGVRALGDLWNEYFDNYTLDLRHVEERDWRVLALLVQWGTIHGSNEVVETEASWVATFEDGLITHVQGFFAWDQARAAFEARS